MMFFQRTSDKSSFFIPWNSTFFFLFFFFNHITKDWFLKPNHSVWIIASKRKKKNHDCCVKWNFIKRKGVLKYASYIYVELENKPIYIHSHNLKTVSLSAVWFNNHINGFSTLLSLLFILLKCTNLIQERTCISDTKVFSRWQHLKVKLII